MPRKRTANRPRAPAVTQCVARLPAVATTRTCSLARNPVPLNIRGEGSARRGAGGGCRKHDGYDPAHGGSMPHIILAHGRYHSLDLDFEIVLSTRVRAAAIATGTRVSGRRSD